jgi:hypothetical protein
MVLSIDNLGILNNFILFGTGKTEAPAEEGAVPAYLLDREHETQVWNNVKNQMVNRH